MTVWQMMSVLVMALVFVFWASRHSHLYVWVTFVAFPLLLTPLLVEYASLSWFGWVKLYSAVFAVAAMQLYRQFDRLHVDGYRIMLWLLLALNIFEAVVKERLNTGGWLNPMVGLLLILTLPGIRLIYVSGSVTRDFEWNIPRAWFVCFSLWDWSFVGACYPQYIAEHGVVLGVGLAIGLYRPTLWVQGRAFLFTAWMIGSVVCRDWLDLIDAGQMISVQDALFTWVTMLALAGVFLWLVCRYRQDGAKGMVMGWERRSAFDH